jgi:hypothetical protein
MSASGGKADDTAPTKAQEQRKPLWKRPLPWIGAFTTAVVTAVAITLANTFTSGAVSGNTHTPAPAGQPTAAVSAAHLQVDEVNLTPAQGWGSPFKLDIRLLNTGSAVAIINHVRLVIQQFALLSICATQGGFGPTGAYAANMPVPASPGQVVDAPISQLVPAGGADRFEVLLRAPILPVTAPMPSSPYGPLPKLNVYVYRVRAYLTYNVGTTPADLGEILITYPGPVLAGEYYWTPYVATHPQFLSGVLTPAELPAYKKCAIANSVTLRSILALPAIRDTFMARVKLSDLAYH